MAGRPSSNKRRRGAGEGSVYQLPDRTWVAAIELPRSASGKRRRKTIKGQNKAEVLRRFTEVKSTLGIVDLPTAGRFTVDELFDRWLEHVKLNRAYSTWQSYERKWRLHLRPALGRKQVAKLTAGDLQRVLDQMSANGSGPRDVQFVRATLHAALGWAEKLGLLNVNIAGRSTSPTVRPPHVEPYTVDQCRQMVRVADQHRFGRFYVLMVATGLRPAEACALTWDDLDLDGPRPLLRVNKAVQRCDDGIVSGGLKTPRSRRTLPLAPLAVSALRSQRQAQREVQLLAGPLWKPNTLVFSTETGGLVDPAAPSHDFRRFCELAGVPRRRLYDLRHTTATFLLAQGIPARVVQEILGHSSYSLTMNTYSHVTGGLLDDAAAAIERAFGAT
jgi:integrase